MSSSFCTKLKNTVLLLLVTFPLTAQVINFDNFVQQSKQSPDEAFQALLQLNHNVIIKFFKSGCGPCQQSNTVFNTFSQQYPQIACVEINISTYPNIFRVFNLKGVPAFVYYQDTVLKGTQVGGGPQLAQNLQLNAKKYFNI
ncbi:MAG: thioredoxin family protein [Candidatus Babeliaceae bacterium]